MKKYFDEFISLCKTSAELEKILDQKKERIKALDEAIEVMPEGCVLQETLLKERNRLWIDFLNYKRNYLATELELIDLELDMELEENE